MPKNPSKRLAPASKQNRPLTPKKRRQLEQEADERYFTERQNATGVYLQNIPSLDERVQFLVEYLAPLEVHRTKRLERRNDTPALSHRLRRVWERAKRDLCVEDPPYGATHNAIDAAFREKWQGIPTADVIEAIQAADHDGRVFSEQVRLRGWRRRDSVYHAKLGRAKQNDSQATSVAGFRSTDYLANTHGIRANRLSEKAGAGLVQTRPAPKGMIDSEGREVRILYNEPQALKYCSPKRRGRKKRTGRNSLTAIRNQFRN